MTGGGFRYGAVLLLTLVTATFTLVAPDGPAARGTGLILAGIALLAAMLTSGARPNVRRATVVVVGAATVLAAGAGIAGAPPGVLALSATAVVNAATIAVILGGLVRLVQERGVGVQAVFGALAVYLLVGLTFGFAIGAVATGFNGDFFAQGTDGTRSLRLYFSYVTLATLGYGDYTPAGDLGHTLAIVEALFGQLYLVTVLALLVSRLQGRRAGRDTDS